MSDKTKAVGRFIHRGSGPNDGLILGAAFKNNPFKPNTLYEIVDILGELVIREVGESIIAGEGETYHDSPVQHTWGTSIEHVINEQGKHLFLSREELAKVHYQEHRAFLISRYDLATIEEWELEGKDLNDIRD
jgi:hypothetical protein